MEGAASRLGLTEYELRELVSGTAHSGVAERLVSIKDMDDFFDGYVSSGMAEALDMPHSGSAVAAGHNGCRGSAYYHVGMWRLQPPAP